jgi:pantothenate synthetase
MEPMEKVEESAVAIIAARVGNTRLIDNLTLMVSEPGHLERIE